MFLNVDGDLLSPGDKGHAYNWDLSEWFAPETGRGKTTFTLNIDETNHLGTANIKFSYANGNRPFPFFHVSRGTLQNVAYCPLTISAKLYLNAFTSKFNAMMRSAFVLVVLDVNDKEHYFEADVKDNTKAKKIMPFYSEDTHEDLYVDVPLNRWTYVTVDFEDFLKRFINLPEMKTLRAAYFVNECFGSGSINYKIKDFWVTTK